MSERCLQPAGPLMAAGLPIHRPRQNRKERLEEKSGWLFPVLRSCSLLGLPNAFTVTQIRLCRKVVFSLHPNKTVTLRYDRNIYIAANGLCISGHLSFERS